MAKGPGAKEGLERRLSRDYLRGSGREVEGITLDRDARMRGADVGWGYLLDRLNLFGSFGVWDYAEILELRYLIA